MSGPTPRKQRGKGVGSNKLFWCFACQGLVLAAVLVPILIKYLSLHPGQPFALTTTHNGTEAPRNLHSRYRGGEYKTSRQFFQCVLRLPPLDGELSCARPAYCMVVTHHSPLRWLCGGRRCATCRWWNFLVYDSQNHDHWTIVYSIERPPVGSKLPAAASVGACDTPIAGSRHPALWGAQRRALGHPLTRVLWNVCNAAMVHYTGSERKVSAVEKYPLRLLDITGDFNLRYLDEGALCVAQWARSVCGFLHVLVRVRRPQRGDTSDRVPRSTRACAPHADCGVGQ